MATAYCTAAEVLERLRLDSSHRDAEYVALCTEAACELIDNYLAAPVVQPLALVDGYHPLDVNPPRLAARTAEAPVITAAAHRAAIGVSTRIYRYKDAEADTSDTWQTAPGVPLRIPRDPLAGYTNLLDPQRHGWGVG